MRARSGWSSFCASRKALLVLAAAGDVAPPRLDAVDRVLERGARVPGAAELQQRAAGHQLRLPIDVEVRRDREAAGDEVVRQGDRFRVLPLLEADRHPR